MQQQAATAAAATITSCRRGDNLFAGEAAAAFFAAFSCAHATVESSAASAPRRGVRTSTLLGVRTWRDARGINPLGAMPENAVNGTIFTVNAQRVDSLQAMVTTHLAPRVTVDAVG